MTYWAERLTPAMDEAVLARIPPEVPRWKVGYWEFQRALTATYIVPWLERRGALPREGRLLEVGAGEGGCLTALTEATGLPGVGVELSESRTHTARAIAAARGDASLSFQSGDITSQEVAETLPAPFALVLLRDVIEHVHEPARALANVASLLAPGGYAVVSFPPYPSPFGAHQQILGPRWLKLPWIQLLPGFPWLVAKGEPREGVVREILDIRRCGLTMHAFERAARAAPLRIVERRAYLLRPAFRFRYGMKPVSGGWIGSVPLLRELVTTGVWYLLAHAGDAPNSA